MQITDRSRPARKPLLLPRYALIGAVIAFAGPPIYIHTPKLYGEIHGLGLATLGLVLAGLRSVDFIQDPLLGWMIGRWHRHRHVLVGLFALLFGLGMTALFAPDPAGPLWLWLAGSLALVFTGFSGLQILFYSTGLDLAGRLNASHARIAAWREAAVLIGVSAACVAPTILSIFFGEARAYWIYSLIFLALLATATAMSWPVWRNEKPRLTQRPRFRAIFGNSRLRWLMSIGFVNSLPTGITSTLFLFYVQDRLGAEIHAGPLLLLFFMSAALSAPFWGGLAAKYSAKNVLVAGMLLAVPAFITAALLGIGDVWIFYMICIASGAALGADMTLIPALLSDELSRSGEAGALTFGIWGFITKMSFAVGAGIALPILAVAGYQPGGENSESILFILALTYAALPCLLKLIAAGSVVVAPIRSERI